MPLFLPSPFSILLSPCLVTAVLYLWRSFLFPLTLAILLALVLAPVVVRLEGWGLKCVFAVSLPALPLTDPGVRNGTLDPSEQKEVCRHLGAVLCLSALTSASARAACTIFKRLGTAPTGIKLLGYWQGDRAAVSERLKQPGIELISRLEEAVRLITSQALETADGVKAPDPGVNPPPA